MFCTEKHRVPGALFFFGERGLTGRAKPCSLPPYPKEGRRLAGPPSHRVTLYAGGVGEWRKVQACRPLSRKTGCCFVAPRSPSLASRGRPRQNLFPGLARGTARIPRKVRGDWHWLRPLETRGSARSTSRPRASLGNGEAERVAGELLAALAALSTVKPKVTRTDRPQGARGPPSPPARRRRSSPRADPAPAAGDWRALGGGAAPRLYKYS